MSANFLIETMSEEAPSVEFIERLDNPPEVVDQWNLVQVLRY
ncbi:class I SAM-dependent methyltransferase [Vibrio lentus]|nr:class I SAM-dependent methyltransferase [Vibrio lentus]